MNNTLSIHHYHTNEGHIMYEYIVHGLLYENMIYSILCTHVNANTIISHPPVRHITIEIGEKHILLAQITYNIER